jgi:hypothetical protein
MVPSFLVRGGGAVRLPLPATVSGVQIALQAPLAHSTWPPFSSSLK